MRKLLLIFIIVIIFSLMLIPEISSTLKGIVVDEKTNLGIPRVTIYFSRHDGETFAYKVITGNDGRFVINDVIPTKYEISYFPPPPYALDRIEKSTTNNFNEYVQVNVGQNNFVKKKMKIGAKLKIISTDLITGNPISRVKYFIPNITSRVKFVPFSDSNGECEIGQFSSGNYSFIANLLGFSSKLVNFTMNYEENKEISITFDSNSKTNVSGFIKCKDSESPIKDIIVTIHRKKPYAYGKCYTDGNGYYSIKDIEPGVYSIGVVAINAGEWLEFDEEYSDLFIEKIITIVKDADRKINFDLDCTYTYESRDTELF